MLFIFLLDNDELMNEIKFSNSFSSIGSPSVSEKSSNLSLSTSKSLKSLDPFLPTSMDASIYLIQQYSKVLISHL